MINTILYRLTAPSGKQYIGVTKKPLNTRICVHRHAQTAIGSAVRKYGDRIKREILVVGEESYIYELEDKAIQVFDTMAPAGYNLIRGGDGGRHTDESKQKISNTMRGRKMSASHRQRLSESHKGNSPDAETRQKMVAAQKARRAREGELEKQALSQKMEKIWDNRSLETRYAMGKRRWVTRRKKS